MQKYTDVLMANLGFFYDETLMLKNTYLNLRSGTAKLYSLAPTPHLESPVFVIGAGPSLDHDLPIIHDNAERAIIISTGTALRSLLVNGITPDFHVELENIHVYSSIHELARKYDLSSLCLAVPTTIDPHITQFFDDIVYFFRANLSPFVLFCDSHVHCLRWPGPLIVNASISFAMDIGAKDIYLFGTDFGSRGTGPDHAKDNVVYTDNAVIGYSREFGTPVAANFGGEFFASRDFNLGLIRLNEMILLDNQGRRFFNCSDGALIEKAKPLRSGQLSLDATPEKKRKDEEQIRGGFATLSNDWFDCGWNDASLKDAINALADGLLKMIQGPLGSGDKSYLAAYMTLTKRKPTTRARLARGDAGKAVAMLFGGTLDMILASIKCYLDRATSPAIAARLRKIVCEEFAVVIETLRKEALALVDDPTDIPPAKITKVWQDNDLISESTYTWGNVPRNAICPCGSGRRYKHCHGRTA